MSDLERFWSRVDRTGPCWLWTGKRNGDGYGYFYAGSKTHRAHRWIYERLVRPLLEGEVVRHRCDNRACVRPEHLAGGTVADNVRDRVRRRRSADFRGDRNPNSRLGASEVERIRRDWDGSWKSAVELGRAVGVDPSHVVRIGRGERWGG